MDDRASLLEDRIDHLQDQIDLLVKKEEESENRRVIVRGHALEVVIVLLVLIEAVFQILGYLHGIG